MNIDNLIISDNMKRLLKEIIDLEEYKYAYYYVRALKKPAHGGRFKNSHQCMFLWYRSCETYDFVKKGSKVPYPIVKLAKRICTLVKNSNVNNEEILQFCFSVDLKDESSCIFGKHIGGAKLNAAYSSGVLKICDDIIKDGYEYADLVCKAVHKEIEFTDYFYIDETNLMKVLACFVLLINLTPIESLNKLREYEHLNENQDKYGLSDITNAEFDRQGFYLEDKYFLYNIFFDISVDNMNCENPMPSTIEVIKKIDDSKLRVFMRLDENLALPREKAFNRVFIGMERWRGIDLSIDDIPLIEEKQVIVRFNPDSMNKLLLVIKPENNKGTNYFEISVEELWSPSNLYRQEQIVITNFIHGCFYPDMGSFDHVDFSVNQYDRAMYESKYSDTFNNTCIPIEKYGDDHYKVWCIRGENISLSDWSKLVYFTLDSPFRNLFVEAIDMNVEIL